jgi:hypothetical protein
MSFSSLHRPQCRPGPLVDVVDIEFEQAELPAPARTCVRFGLPGVDSLPPLVRRERAALPVRVVVDGGGNIAHGTIHDRVLVQGTGWLAFVRWPGWQWAGGLAGERATASRHRLLGHPAALVGARRQAVGRARRHAASDLMLTVDRRCRC